MVIKRITNWGRYPRHKAREIEYSTLAELQEAVRNSGQIIARGMGRSYGDASLGDRVFSTAGLNRILHFDPEKGTMTCEAGVSLESIIHHISEHGWFLPVTPGTKYVSVGGAIAADIHGKNHHIDGTFGDHVVSLKLMRDDGEILECSRDSNAAMFAATLGGMGLTGIITQATFSLKQVETTLIVQKTTVCENLTAMLRAFDQHSSVTYSVAWLDCFATGSELGKGILFTGEHARTDQLSDDTRGALKFRSKRLFSLPFAPPAFLLNKLVIRMFNRVYFSRNAKNPGQRLVDADTFFYPLDKIGNWNKMYGARGFVQYQFVIPREGGEAGLRRILERISKGNYGSFLAVLKLFGRASEMLSFPFEGYTLALDFPVNQEVFELLDDLDAIVLECGGRIYLAKDARMSQRTFEKGYPELSRFHQVNKESNPSQKFSSLLSQRLGMNWGKTALILGAKSAIASATAQQFASAGYNLILAARNAESIDTSGFDCRVKCVDFDALDVESHRSFYESLPVKPSVAVVSFGYLGDQQAAQDDFKEASRIVCTNYVGALSICEIIAADMEKREEGSIIGVSSIAGERGRKSNYIYGSSKAGFTAYLSGLRNRLAGNNVHVVTVKPGFVDTPMTKDIDLPGKLTASAEQVARKIFSAFKGKKNVVYSLGIWRWIMLIIRNIPERIFKKTNL